MHAGIGEPGTALIPFLTTLRSWVADERLALVHVDIKFRDEAKGKELAKAINQQLAGHVSVVFGCSSFDGLELSSSSPFWGGTLGGVGQVLGFHNMNPSEGVLFDEEPGPSDAVGRLLRAGFRNVGYGFGTTHVPLFNSFPPPVDGSRCNHHRRCRRACDRAGSSKIPAAGCDDTGPSL